MALFGARFGKGIIELTARRLPPGSGSGTGESRRDASDVSGVSSRHSSTSAHNHVRAKSRRHEEKAIEKAITDYLAFSLPGDALSFHVPNGGFKLSIGELAWLKASGYVAGIPDRVVLWNGRAHFLECKRPKGILSDSQKAMFPRIEAAGCPIVVVRSVEDVAAALDAWGIPVRSRMLAL